MPIFRKGGRNEATDNFENLQPAVRTLHHIVRSPRQRSTRLSYQAANKHGISVLYSYDDDHWNSFKEFLLQNHNLHTAKVRLSYSKKYYNILVNGNAQELLVLSNDKRIHVMKAIATLSKYIGCYDKWKDIKEKYQLKWSNGDGLEAFNDIIMNNGQNYNSMINWLKVAVSKLPARYGNLLLFDTLTGLRPDEACKSIILLKEKEQEGYLNPDTMILEHFRHPGIFFRRTKKAYVSILTEKSLELVKESATCGYNALRLALRRRGLDMNMAYCRKIFATYLRMHGIEQEVIDLLQGRAPKSVFARYYFRPDFNHERIKEPINSLYYSLIETCRSSGRFSKRIKNSWE
ncbi:MAG: integrase [Nitrososphaeraceae archaeon]